MRTTIDKAGRVVIPKKIRQEAGLAPGMELEVHLDNGTIKIEPTPAPMDLVWRGPLLVAVPRLPGPLLTMDDVKRVREAIERERFHLPDA